MPPVSRTGAGVAPPESPDASHVAPVLFRGDVLDAYPTWPNPSTIVSDGAYGVGGFPGDPRTTEGLEAWYAPHVAAWARYAIPSTTLWFWNTELGWASVHPLLVRYGFEYVQTIVWDKGVAHIAGNVNGTTIRRFPVVTEVCVFYRRRPMFPTAQGHMRPQEWLRYEWRRAGLRFSEANKACGVRNAATRKYLASDWLWYWPPPQMMERLVRYANECGSRAGVPYFSMDGKEPVSAIQWASLRDRWHHIHGLTNVWSAPPLHGDERFKGNEIRSAPRVHRPGASAAVHLNQKPLEFMRRILSASTDLGDVVWEPFGGLCSASVAAIELGRCPVAAEAVDRFADLAAERLQRALATAKQSPSPSPATEADPR